MSDQDGPRRGLGRGWDASGPFAVLVPATERSAVVLVLGVLAVPFALLGGLGLVPAVVALAVAPGATVQMRRRALDPRAGRPRGTRWQIRVGVTAALLAIALVAAEVVLAVLS